MFRTKCLRSLLLLLTILCLSATEVRGADILFVTAEVDPLRAGDAPIVEFLEGLGHTVILIDDNEDEPTTEAAAREADVVFISESVGSGNIRTEITEIETPIIVAEAWGWDEMGLNSDTQGGLTVASTNIDIVKPNHFLAAGLSGTVQVLDATGGSRLGTGIAGSQATVIARAALSDGQTYDVLYVYEKGAALPVAPADGSPQVAAEMRICFGFDELSVVNWNDNTYALLKAAVDYALGEVAPTLNPRPFDEQEDVFREVMLSWTPLLSENIQTYDLYFGTNFDDVSSAAVGSPLLVGPGQDANSYDLGRLKFGETYYWRVDGISAPPKSEILKGRIWSFTVEPYARPIPVQAISATASSQSPDQGPEKTVDRSGLKVNDVNDLHSNIITDMWLSEASEPNLAWIQYEFDKPYKLHQMLVWNFNGEYFFSGYGLKDVTIAYSTDGVDWIQINDVFEKAPGTEDYAPNTTVEFGGVVANMVRITANSNWGTGALYNQYGLSEVQFLQIPVSARIPIPESGAADVAIDVTLGWKPGREAAEHIVYISTEEQAVRDGTVSGVTVLQESYGPLSLDLGSMYYWRIDEVNNAGTVPIWEGGTWSFTTSEYLVVDDFESYNTTDRQIWETWLDGLGYGTPGTPDFNPGNGTGSAVGDENSPSYMEETIVHGGSKSLPLAYNNSVASISEVIVNTSDLPIGSDWTKGSPEQLTLWFYGDPANAATDQMYVKVNSAKKIFDGSLAQSSWQEFPIDLASLGIDLSNVTTLTIGLERTGVTGGSGMIFIDDIRLYAPLNN